VIYGLTVLLEVLLGSVVLWLQVEERGLPVLHAVGGLVE